MKLQPQSTAAGKLRAKCDADDRFTPPGRLEAREEELKALQQSVEAISPAFSRFENELTDAQKAQLRGVLNLQQLFRKLHGDMPFGGRLQRSWVLAVVLFGHRHCQGIAPQSFATIEARRALQSIARLQR